MSVDTMSELRAGTGRGGGLPQATSPETSVVIRAFNEERWLPEVLAALTRQTYRAFEVLLVDSGSVDRTREIAAAFGARIVRLRSEDFTFGHSLNLGIREARGSLIAIISAHAIPTDDRWLERLVTPLRRPETAMVFGGQRGHAVSKFSEARDFERMFPPRPQVMDDDHVFVNNANSAIRRDLWEQHPFDEGLPGLEDAEWAKYWIPRGKVVLYEPSACIFHVHTESWAQVRHRFHREGIAGRWTAVRIIRNIPGEVLRELYWACLDLSLAARQRRPGALAGEIARYRYNKTVGIVKGILDSRVITNPSKRAELHFDKGYGAVVIRGPHAAALEPRSIPTLRPSEVLVRVAYVGICATDLEILEGRLGYYKTGMAKYPIVPGHEVSGTVVSLGKKVTGLEEGDRVVVECIQGCGTCDDCRRDRAITCRERREVGVIGVDGGYAEYMVTRARYVHRVPPGVTLAQAALAEPLAVVMKALRRLGAVPGGGPRRCAIVGAGAIGHLAARVLALRGHAVTVFDREPARLALLDDVARTAAAPERLAEFDWLIDATGDQGALEQLLQHSATGATLLLVGLPYAQHPFSFESIVAFDRTVVGSVGSSGADFDEALATLPRLDTRPFFESRYALEDFGRAWAAVRARGHLKVMLRVDASAV
ncbi:MAG TPA: alcohol dehydrogenase catalytic domain-containing protein [Longimicrobiales bacterium]|nr:alcohol dehydrogenase catalytic domain-containing protein [Longimicrobiales bacterium]